MLKLIHSESARSSSELPRLKRVEKGLMLMMIGAAVALPIVALAQYLGPTEQAVYASVADVLAEPVDDAHVSLQGLVVLHEGGDFYRFADASGEIRIELEVEDMPAFSFDDKTPVRITGEIDNELMRKPFIEVERVELTEAS
ncbi:YgiW/YdeI family stress tolerance OB fold protein [Granulosicoccus antarcticus]|uniref:Uncharacterized protein n=1 Tax=Granulosicoccus antarcticus IMCC3135 TaxID=1192854 RepID=A0A2Z2NQV7_9GAMM|nr:NirD/YgiW/YdeI family stress tolerance protein [Granulosicoccus antarcticus]ASJ73609.1 hypothetical protein IMCC3135_17650 [Granulosicoccus antarcticus IMCC3135]